MIHRVESDDLVWFWAQNPNTRPCEMCGASNRTNTMRATIAELEKDPGRFGSVRRQEIARLSVKVETIHRFAVSRPPFATVLMRPDERRNHAAGRPQRDHRQRAA